MSFTMGLKPISRTRTGSYFSASDASPCQVSNVTKTGMNILCNSYWNLDHVLRIPCGEVIYVSILISGLTTWYVHLFSFNTCSINRTWRSFANIGRSWFASPGCPSFYINATDVPTNLRSQEFYGITPRYIRKGMIRRFANTWKIYLSTICRTLFSNITHHYSRLTWLKGHLRMPELSQQQEINLVNHTFSHLRQRLAIVSDGRWCFWISRSKVRTWMVCWVDCCW